MIKTKLLTISGLIAVSISAVGVIATSGGYSFAQADGSAKKADFIPALASVLSGTPNTSPDFKTITCSGVDYSIEYLLCSADSEEVCIEKGGYIRNISALNGLSKINLGGSVNDVTVVDCVADSDVKTISPVNAYQGSSSVSLSNTNFILKSQKDGTKLSSLEVEYLCPNVDDRLNTKNFTWSAECAFYDYNADGESSETPYKINNELEFVIFSDSVLNGETYAGKHFELVSDLDFTKEDAPTFVPVGDCTLEAPFEGHFTGVTGGSSINLNVRLNTGGLFGYILGDAVVEKLIVNGTMYFNPGGGNIGGIVGYANGGTIRNCTVNCNFLPNPDYNDIDVYGIGGIVGVNECETKIYDCVVNSKFVCSIGSMIGGLVGVHDSVCLLKRCTFNGEMEIEEESVYSVGGFVGTLFGDYPTPSIQECEIGNNLTSRFNFNINEDQSLGSGDSSYIGYLVGEAFNSDDYYFEDCPRYYLNPGVWEIDGAWFAAYCWDKDGGDYWFALEKDYLSNYYKCDFDLSLYDGVIFVRLETETLELDWGNKWNQTGDLSYSEGNNLFTITDWGSGYWSSYDA